ncbi:MAG: error-prone DNA polymerase [Acidobacteriota bacterium]
MRHPSPPPYCELRMASAFSFLDGSSDPEALAQRAAELEMPAAALVDVGGVYGAPRFYQAAKEAGVRPLVGAQVVLTPKDEDHPPRPDAPRVVDRCDRLTLLVESSQGYRNLCRLLTAAARPHPKGEARAPWELVEAHAAGLHCLTGGDEGPVARCLAEGGVDLARRALGKLAATFPGRLHVELQRHQRREQEHRNAALIDLAHHHRLPLLATNGVRYARRRDKPLHDVLTCLRHHVTLDTAGRRLSPQGEAQLKSADEMARLFADQPGALAASHELAQRLTFTLAQLGYRFPDFPLPSGESPDSYLRHITWNAARARFRPMSARAQGQIEKELNVIEKLGLAGYFLVVWDIIRFCQERGILVQGRGSAANSAVCYALSITAVDPVKMELLFERFLSEERGEWPDIDLDLPSGHRREEVLQYVYRRYGPHGAAMTANVITYRDRSAAREVAKVLGFSEEQTGKLSKQLGSWSWDLSRGDTKDLEDEIRATGLDPEERRVQLFTQLWQRIQGTPRHLGQHSGGMVIAAGRLDEVVPLEPAAMPGRTVIQWDKEDCADLGIIKVDLLGLGMLNALEQTVPMIRDKEKINLDLAHLPPDDPKTYAMLRQADTVGVFQVESRAQMASLPRNRPERFYDLVIQVAIIRPGPIVGGMVHPYFERRQGRQPVSYPHPDLAPVLKRTLGVPLFQEQILRIAMIAAGFTGGEAEQLRRAMGFKRSAEKMEELVARLRSGMQERGYGQEIQDAIVKSITSFALYGFPESHAASFALIAYASAYLKAHHPTAFLIGLLNAWPMGFYHPSSLIQDARRHGVQTLPIDVQRSGWACRWEKPPRPSGAAGACRLGLRFLRGLRHESGLAIEKEQPFDSLEDLARRCNLRDEELRVLSQTGALEAFGLTRREALWQAARISRDAGPLFDQQPDTSPSPLPEMDAAERLVADYTGAGLTLGQHPVAFWRDHLRQRGVVPLALLPKLNTGAKVRMAGSVIVRQRPSTAKGVVFITLEDESGMAQAILQAELFRKHRATILNASGLVIEGKVQKKDGSLSVSAKKVWGLEQMVEGRGRDWR